MSFSAETRERAQQIIDRYPAGRERSALLPLLHLVQSEDGYVTPQGVAFCAEVLRITKAEVGAVATFYTMYKRRPTGDWLVSVCTNTVCGVQGGDKIYEALEEHLGVGHNQTAGNITFEHAECLAACDYAPVVTVNYEFFDNMTAEAGLDLVKDLQNGQRPQPSRGARLCTFKEMSIQLAGFADPREEVLGDGPAGAATVAGNRVAERYGISVPGFDPDTPIGNREKKQQEKPASAGSPAADRSPSGTSPMHKKDGGK
jgi:NADH-quinone oxidoreductase subunit E